MTTKSWNKLSTMLNGVLSESLDKESVENIMSAWSSKKAEVSKLMEAKVRTKRKKDPNAPKKWNTSYIFFCSDYREKVKKNNPSLSATEITSKLGEQWKTISEKEKKKYEDMSRKDKIRYEKEMESYTPPVDNDKLPSGKKERTGPKRPLTAYMYFCQDKRPSVKAENPDLDGKGLTSELAAFWKSLSSEDKTPYEDKQATDKARYESEKASFGSNSTESTSEKSKAVKEVTKPAPEKSKGKAVKEVTKPEKSKGKAACSSKKPETPGFQYFTKDQTEELETENPDWTSKKIQAEVNKRWNELSRDDRDAYEDEASAAVEESEVELDD